MLESHMVGEVVECSPWWCHCPSGWLHVIIINTVIVWSVSCKCFLHKNWCKQQLIAVILYSHNCPSVSELQRSRAHNSWLFLKYLDCLITDCLVNVLKGVVFAGGLVKKANCRKWFLFLSTIWWLTVAVSCVTNSGNLVSKICIISKCVVLWNRNSIHSSNVMKFSIRSSNWGNSAA